MVGKWTSQWLARAFHVVVTSLRLQGRCDDDYKRRTNSLAFPDSVAPGDSATEPLKRSSACDANCHAKASTTSLYSSSCSPNLSRFTLTRQLGRKTRERAEEVDWKRFLNEKLAPGCKNHIPRLFYYYVIFYTTRAFKGSSDLPTWKIFRFNKQKRFKWSLLPLIIRQ